MTISTDKTSASLYSGSGSLWNPGDLSQGGAVDPSGPSFYPNGTIDLKGEDGEPGKQGPQGEPGPGVDGQTLDRIDALELKTAEAAANYLEEIRLRIEGDRVEALHREELGASLVTELGSQITAKIEEVKTILIDGDRAEATAREQLGVSIKTQLGAEIDAKVSSAVKVVADDQHALAERVDALQAGFNDPSALDARIDAKVSQASLALAEADRALAQRLDEASATYVTSGQAQAIAASTATAKVTDAQSVLAQADKALSDRIGAVEASYVTAGAANTIAAAVATAKVSEAQSVQATTNKALSDRIGAVEASYVTAGGATGIATSVATAKVSEAQSAQAATNKSLSDRLGTVEATYITAPTANGIAASVADARVAEEARVRSEEIGAQASRSANIEAAYGRSGYLNRNALFNETWTNPNGLPPGWSYWATDGSPTISRWGGGGGLYGGGALQIDRAGLNCGAKQDVVGSIPKGWYVLDVEARFEDGDTRGSGLWCQFYNSANVEHSNGGINFISDVDSAQFTGGRTNRKFTKLIWCDQDSTRITLYLMAGWEGFANPSPGFLRTIWFKAGIRPATKSEIDAKTVIDANVVARVGSLEYATSNPDGAVAKRLTNVEATAGNAQSRVGDLEYATSNPNGSVARRISNVESTAGDAQARVGGVEYAISNPGGAVVQRFNNVEAVAGGASSTASIALDAARDAQGKLGQARVRLLADAGNGRAQLELYADSYGNAGADLTGNLRVRGDLVVDGSINGQQKLAPNSISNSVFVSQGAKNLSVSGAPGTSSTVSTDPVYFGATGGVVRLDYKLGVAVNAAVSGANWRINVTVRGTDGSVYGSFAFNSTGSGTSWYNGDTGWVLDTRGQTGTLGYYFESQLITQTYPSTTVSASITPSFCIQEFKR